MRPEKSLDRVPYLFTALKAWRSINANHVVNNITFIFDFTAYIVCRNKKDRYI